MPPPSSTLRPRHVLLGMATFVLVAWIGFQASSYSTYDVPLVVSPSVPLTSAPEAKVKRVAVSMDHDNAADQQQLPPRVTATQPSPQPMMDGGGTALSCDDVLPGVPLSPLEQEVKRIYDISLKVLADLNATAWPTDGTLLGMMRNGRIATDRDADFQIHSTLDQCFNLLSSLKAAFAKHCNLQSFKVVKATVGGKKVGRYAMVRMHRQYGTFSTGVDFNCVYMDAPGGPKFHVHKGTLEPVPKEVYPLGKCLLYGRSVPCPKDGFSVLESLKPRYNGCMVYPHCVGNPVISDRKCLSPHPNVPVASYLASVKKLHECGFTSLWEHSRNHPQCAEMRDVGETLRTRNCQTLQGETICFLQGFKG